MCRHLRRKVHRLSLAGGKHNPPHDIAKGSRTTAFHIKKHSSIFVVHNGQRYNLQFNHGLLLLYTRDNALITRSSINQQYCRMKKEMGNTFYWTFWRTRPGLYDQLNSSDDRDWLTDWLCQTQKASLCVRDLILNLSLLKEHKTVCPGNFNNNLHLRNISGTHINYAFTIHNKHRDRSMLDGELVIVIAAHPMSIDRRCVAATATNHVFYFIDSWLGHFMQSSTPPPANLQLTRHNPRWQAIKQTANVSKFTQVDTFMGWVEAETQHIQ